MEIVYFAATITVACFVQAVAGFGLPMIATAVLVALFGIQATVPLIAVIILELQLFLVARYRASLDLRAVWRISSAAAVGIPIGVLFLSRIPETVTIPLLGLILIGYVAHSSLALPVPALKSPRWAYLFGLFSGLGAGAYNIAGPPMIIYGDTQRWEPQRFKGNLHGCFLVITTVAILTHSLSGNMTAEVLRKSLIALPFVLAGAWAGTALDRFIDRTVFRRIVLVLLLVLGVNLMLGWWR